MARLRALCLALLLAQCQTAPKQEVKPVPIEGMRKCEKEEEPTMNFSGLHAYLLGDSLSLPGRTPGQVFALWSRDAGATMPVNAVGGFAVSYWRPKLGQNKYRVQALKMSQAALNSGASVVFALLLTNDCGQSNEAISAGIQELDRVLGGRLFLLGPPAFDPSVMGGGKKNINVEAGTDRAVSIARQLLGARFLDTKPLSRDLIHSPYRAKDGIHFTAKGAEVYGGRIFYALQGRATAPKRASSASTFSRALVTGLLVGGLLEILKMVFGKPKRRK